MKRIHILGASGSGTTTLARALADALGCAHLDTDDYFWIRTDPPFRSIREREERREMLRRDLTGAEAWTLSGSLCGWGDFAIPLFDLVIFLLVPPAIRMSRLRARELERYGPEILDPDDPRHETHAGFIDWARAYDTGGPEQRSRVMHEAWLARLPGPVLRIEGTRSVVDNTTLALRRLQEDH